MKKVGGKNWKSKKKKIYINKSTKSENVRNQKKKEI